MSTASTYNEARLAQDLALPTHLGPVPLGATKSSLTTLVAALFVLMGVVTEGTLSEALLSFGLFAFSGAVTNWIAIHMLFERVPGLYGSGVVQARFEEIRTEIRALILDEFFNLEHIRRVVSGAATDTRIDLAPVAERVDLEPAWQGLVEVVMTSRLGGALGMMGGKAALDPLKDPFLERTRSLIAGLSDDPAVLEAIASAGSSNDQAEAVRERVVAIIDERVAALTPNLIKGIIKRMIQAYLGWLVVWGGVFGGAIGLTAWIVDF